MAKIRLKMVLPLSLTHKLIECSHIGSVILVCNIWMYDGIKCCPELTIWANCLDLHGSQISWKIYGLVKFQDVHGTKGFHPKQKLIEFREKNKNNTIIKIGIAEAIFTKESNPINKTIIFV